MLDSGLSDEFIAAAMRLPDVVRGVLLEEVSESEAKQQAAELLGAFSNSRSCGSSEVLHCTASLSEAACAKLRDEVDQRRQLDKDTVDRAPTHQRNLDVSEVGNAKP